MTRKEYLDSLMNEFDLVETLSRKENSSLLLLRHKKLGQEMVVRSTFRRLMIADYLKTVLFPYLPEVYDVLRFRDGDVVLEEALKGETLEQKLASGTLSFREASDILICIADALTVIHEAGFVHRDIKPKNIMITDDGFVKLIDFDAARIVVSGNDTVRLGTAGFAAPEQYVGQSDQRSDIFALGVLLNIMLTGKHPSEALPRSFRARKIVEKATSMNPDKRFSSAEEFKKAL